MKPDPVLRAQLYGEEGDRKKPYKDTKGYWTIGCGHLIDPSMGANPAPFGVNLITTPGASITQEQEDQLLDEDINDACDALDKHLPWWRQMSTKRQYVIIDMCFNLGINKMMAFTNTLAAMQSGNYVAAAQGMLASKWATQVGDRAKHLADMMVKG